MTGTTEDGVLVGTFVSFRKVNPLSAHLTARFKADGRIIDVLVDYRQRVFIQREHPVGSKVALGYYGGQWHIKSKSIIPDVFLKTPSYLE